MKNCYLKSTNATGNFLCVVWILFVYLVPTASPAACSGELVGQTDPNNANVNSPGVTDTDATLLFVNNYHEVQCCGIITRWEAYVEGPGTIDVQAWRPVTGQSNTYTMLGYNSITNAGTGITLARKRPAARFRIPVAPGDYIGFHSVGTAIVRYDSCQPVDPTSIGYCAEKVYRTTAIGTVDAGHQQQFDVLQSSTLGTTQIRNYAMTASLSAKPDVSCTGRTFTMPDTLAVGDQVTTVDTSNMDTYHSDSKFSITATAPTLPVQINAQSGEITVSGTLTPDYPSSVHTITVEVVDVCGSTASCTFTVTVQNVAQPILFTNLPAEQTLDRDSVTPLPLRHFSLSSQRDVDDVTCSIASTTPTTDAFELTTINKTEYTIGLKSGGDLTPLANDDVVVLLISCENSGGEYGQSTLTLHLRPKDKDKSIFWYLVGGFALLFCIGAGCIIMACCVRAGICKLWPSSTPTTSSAPSEFTKIKKMNNNNNNNNNSSKNTFSEKKIQPIDYSNENKQMDYTNLNKPMDYTSRSQLVNYFNRNPPMQPSLNNF